MLARYFQKSLFLVNQGHNSVTMRIKIIKFNLYFVKHDIVVKFQRIWCSCILFMKGGGGGGGGNSTNQLARTLAYEQHLSKLSN